MADITAIFKSAFTGTKSNGEQKFPFTEEVTYTDSSGSQTLRVSIRKVDVDIRGNLLDAARGKFDYVATISRDDLTEIESGATMSVASDPFFGEARTYVVSGPIEVSEMAFLVGLKT